MLYAACSLVVCLCVCLGWKQSWEYHTYDACSTEKGRSITRYKII